VKEDESERLAIKKTPTEKKVQTGRKKVRRNRAKAYRKLTKQKCMAEACKQKKLRNIKKRYSRLIYSMKNQSTSLWERIRILPRPSQPVVIGD